MTAGALLQNPNADPDVLSYKHTGDLCDSHEDARWWKVVLALSLALLAFYLFMFLRYRPYDIDNPWFLSFSYGRFAEHIRSDQFMNVAFPDGMDGTQYFGLLAAFSQYLVACIGRWRQWPMEILSAGAVALSTFFWSVQLKRLGYSSRFIFAFVVLAGFSEPFVSTAEKFRFEYLSLLLISAGLLALTYRQLLLGFFLVAIAAEIEPMAALGIIPAAVLACSLCQSRRYVMRRMIAAGAAATAIFLCLHPHISDLFRTHKSNSGLAFNGGFFRAYFLDRHRHLPELLFYAVAGWLYWRNRKSIRSHYLGISAALLTLASFLAPHANAAYIVLIYPFLVCTAVIAVRAERYPLRFAVLVLACLLPQYALLAYMNRDGGYRRQDILQVSAAIDSASREAGIEPDDLSVYGSYGLWFAHPHLYRAASPTTLPYADKANLFLCYDHPVATNGMIATNMLYCPDLRQRFALALISTTSVRGNTLYIYAKESDYRGRMANSSTESGNSPKPCSQVRSTVACTSVRTEDKPKTL